MPEEEQPDWSALTLMITLLQLILDVAQASSIS